MVKLDYFFGVEAAIRAYPEGGTAGDCFVNGETGSLWIWDPLLSRWCNTQREQSGTVGLVGNSLRFVPRVEVGRPALYGYLGAEEGEVCFTWFRNDGEPLKVVLERPSFIWLSWNGSRWYVQLLPLLQEAVI